MCIGYIQILCHFIQGTWAPTDLGINRSWNQPLMALRDKSFFFSPFYDWWIFHCTDTTFCWSTHQLVNIWAGSLFSFMNNASVDIHVQVFMETHVDNCLGHYPYLMSYIETLCLTLWEPVRLFHSSCTILHSHQQCMRVQLLLHLHQHLLLSVF